MRTLSLLFAAAMIVPAANIEVQGHRGARTVRPENTLAAFNYAIQAGADVLEMDIRVTKDGVVVVSHDGDLKPPVCSGPEPKADIRQLTLKQVKQWDCGSLRNPGFPHQELSPGERIPTLDEVLALAPQGKFRFNIETKVDKSSPSELREMVKLLADAIRKHHLESRANIQSFDFRTLHEMKKLLPELPRAALYSGAQRDFVEIARKADAGIVSPHYSLVTKAQVDASHRAGLKVIAWTANDEKVWADLVAAGVDGIITDDPAGLIAYLKARGLRQ
ncbi:MAG: glycerophosphodiester phosphodiesterase family protein [Bryobacteraceae bacterium]